MLLAKSACCNLVVTGHPSVPTGPVCWNDGPYQWPPANSSLQIYGHLSGMQRQNYHRQGKILSQSMLVFPVFEEVFVVLYWASPSRTNISICNYLAPIAFLYLLYFYTVIKISYGYY